MRVSPPSHSEQSVSVQLLPGPQRGALQAAAQVGAAFAFMVETGAAEGEVAWRKQLKSVHGLARTSSRASRSYQNAVKRIPLRQEKEARFLPCAGMWIIVGWAYKVPLRNFRN